MKRCPECRRDYYDDSLLYCLDDGQALLEGPSSREPATQILSDATVGPSGSGETMGGLSNAEKVTATPNRIRSKSVVSVVLLAILVSGGMVVYRNYFSGRQIDSVAVLPFVNDGGDPDIEYISDGMTEMLISSLSQVPKLSVRARSSVFRYKGTTADVHQIAKDLNVGAILTGTVTQRGQEISVYAELLDVSSDRVVWSKSYNRPIANFVTLQSDLANDALRGLQPKISSNDVAKVRGNGTANSQAYQLYLQGRYHWNKRTPTEIVKAIDYLNQAIALDPNYALAYSALADCYAVESSPETGTERLAKLQAAAKKATELDGTLGEPHAALASMLWSQHKWAEAEDEFKQAIDLEPNYATAHQWYGEMLTRLARHDEAIEQINKALQLDPLSLIANSDRIYILECARRYDEAIEQAKHTIELDPRWESGHTILAYVYVRKGMYEESLNELISSADLKDWPAGRKSDTKQQIEEIRQAYRSSGAHGFWTGMLDLEEKHPFGDGPSPFNFAEIYANLGEMDEAFTWLEKAVEADEGGADLIKVYPGFDSIHNHPRFAELLKRLNLPL